MKLLILKKRALGNERIHLNIILHSLEKLALMRLRGVRMLQSHGKKTEPMGQLQILMILRRMNWIDLVLFGESIFHYNLSLKCI